MAKQVESALRISQMVSQELYVPLSSWLLEARAKTYTKLIAELTE